MAGKRKPPRPLAEVKAMEPGSQDQVEQTVPPPRDPRKRKPPTTPRVGLPETGPVAEADSGMKTPDISLAQVVGVVIWFCSQLIGMGLVDNPTSKLVLMAGATLLVGVWLLADAIIRHGRSRALGLPPRPPLDGNKGA